MKSHCLPTSDKNQSNSVKVKRTSHPGTWLNKPVALLLAAAMLPVWLINSVEAVLRRKPLLNRILKLDALGREVSISEFNVGYVRNSAVLFDILKGKLAFVGASVHHTLDYQSQVQIPTKVKVLPSLTSCYDVHLKTGLTEFSAAQMMDKQLAMSVFGVIALLLKFSMQKICFNKDNLSSPKLVSIFGLKLNNISMKKAVNWVVSSQNFRGVQATQYADVSTKVGFYINAHSINTLAKKPEFKQCLNSANALFADGSGIRLAAKSKGFDLVANLNGTDMLPKLCKSAAAAHKSIFLLGGAEGIAQKAADNLQQQFPQLHIAGTHHGFFDFEDQQANQSIVEQINDSCADIVLVGFGSPHQENWCLQHANQLECQTVLAVGGLFDFFSGSIPRAPMFMRELGMEWVWRLMQEPKAKFSRYVIGTPEFLFRTFVLKQA